MSYQPLNWTFEKLRTLKDEHIDLISLYNDTDLSNVERFTIDRAVSIVNYLREKGNKYNAVLDLGASGGLFAIVLRMALNVHVTAVDDDRYITVQGEESSSSINEMKNRIEQNNIKQIIPVNSSIELFLDQLPPFALYDCVLFLNVLHHFYTGYGQLSNYGQLSWDETKKLIEKIGKITSKYLFFEINSLVIDDFEKYLTELMYLGRFREIEYVTRSFATDGNVRNVWCFIK